MDPEYANAPISPGDITKYKFRKISAYRQEKLKLRYMRQYDRQLFLKAAQNLHLMQADINFARNSITHQEISINQISSIVSCLQKEINILELKDNYDAEVQKLRDGYKEKVETYKEKIEFAKQTNLSMLNEINLQADEAEKEADELSLQGREKVKIEFDNYFDNQTKSLKQQLKEAQSELVELQNLSDKATIARKRIDDFHNMKKQQNQNQVTPKIGGRAMTRQPINQKAVLNSSRVADQFRNYQAKNQKTSRRFFPNNF